MTTDLTIISNNDNNKKCFIACEVKNNEDKKRLFNALNKCDNVLNDCVGKEIVLSNAYIECKEALNDESGEVTKEFKSIIFDENGKSYVTKSYMFYITLSRILQIYDLNQEKIKVKIIKNKLKDNKQALSLELL